MKNLIIYLAAVFTIGNMCVPELISAQYASSPITLSGTSRMYGQFSNRQGSNQQVPANYWRWDLNATLSVYGMPISLKTFLSTEQSSQRQNMNAVQIYFNPQQFFKQKAMNKFSKVLSWFSNISIGRSYPRYSPLTLNGAAVTGVNVEFTPGIIYFALAIGKTQKAISNSDIIEPTYARYMFATRFGLGRKRSTHLHFTFLHARDDEKSLANDTSGVTPKENYLIGTDVNIFLFKRRFNLQGELAVSMLTRDITSAEVRKEDLKQVPSWMISSFKPKISSSVDYAYSVKSYLNLNNTRLSGAVKMIGPGFYSLGVPYLRNDELTYEARIRQSLWRRKVTVSSYLRRSRDNLIPWKRTTTISSAYGINLTLRFRNLPYLQLNYAPYFQNNDMEVDSLKTDNKTSLFSMATGYAHKFGDIVSSTNFFFSSQHNKTHTGIGDYSSQNYSLNEMVSFQFPLTVMSSLSFNNSNYSQQSSKIISFDLSGSYTGFKKWRSSFGLRLTNQKGQNNKTGFYLMSSFPAWKFGDMNIRAEQNFFRATEDIASNYDEFVLRATLTKRW